MIEHQTNPDRNGASPETSRILPAPTRAEYEALQNDVYQAREMAAEFQRQLAGKSNDFWELKRLYETTVEAVTALQVRVSELRQERHALANKGMQMVGLEQRLASLSAERHRLNSEVTALRHDIATEAEESARRAQERDAHIGRLTLEVASLKERLQAGRAVPGAWAAARRMDAEVKSAMAEISNSLARLMAVMEPAPATAKRTPSPSPPSHLPLALDDNTDCDISFSK